jgi:hypothetical protein
MASATVVVKGYRETAKAARNSGTAVNKEVRDALKQAAEPVRAEAVSRFSTVDARSAAGYVVRVRAKGVAVEQRRKKTTGTRGDYGSLQMRRALIPALTSNLEETMKAMEKAVDDIVNVFER